ncbi:(deoxy)nucleoside triphosphate pyrophosphohydrolase [Alteraurantiacibacter buctensis]|uniref:8-oxo-dGTP diphosphatase n=1 Tax=Alteraurantiacibacter buctensis TaxID=1503981 RepID=A0A844YZB1_9SPHN|nr:(deoxy)nucleoside triphosphate pyrophosphohydrolase [Alteraurantiacibacter buctensis]MXO72408.1 NUDIX domain-containing protein [Alteraurantiacibacter buctensis]
MASNPTAVLVVALGLAGPDGRWLLQQRPPGKHHAGLWEFPGGKVESAENQRLALCREVAEELAITLDPAALSPAWVADDWPQGNIVLILYTATRWQGEIVGLEGQQWGWFTLGEMAALPLAPMDRSFAARLAQ